MGDGQFDSNVFRVPFMSALQRAIADLAQNFAAQVVKAIGTASLQDIAALTGGAAAPSRARTAPAAAPAAPAKAAPAAASRRGGSRRRRTADDLAALGGRIVDLLKTNSGGMRAEAIRDQLNVPRKELPRVFAQLVSSGAVKKSGQKRATTYFVGDGSKSAPAKRGSKKVAKKSKK